MALSLTQGEVNEIIRRLAVNLVFREMKIEWWMLHFILRMVL